MAVKVTSDQLAKMTPTSPVNPIIPFSSAPTITSTNTPAKPVAPIPISSPGTPPPQPVPISRPADVTSTNQVAPTTPIPISRPTDFKPGEASVSKYGTALDPVTHQPIKPKEPISISKPVDVKPGEVTKTKMGTDIDPKTGKPVGAGTTIEQKDRPPDEVVTQVVKDAEEGTRSQSNIDTLTDVATQWATGKIDDKIFERSVNNAISNMALFNQADIEALQQQIAGDPNLKGTGLGYGMLAMAAREAGFKTSDMISKLSIESLDRIIDMQKFGMSTLAGVITTEEGMRRFDIGQENILNDRAYNRAEALEKKNYNREVEGIQTLVNLGQTGEATKALQGFFDKYSPGSGITIDPNAMALTNPFMMDQLNRGMEDAKTAALTNPDDAIAILQGMKDNPLYGNMFSTMDPEAVVASFLSGEFEANQTFFKNTNEEINAVVASEEGFWDAESLYQALDDKNFRGVGGFAEAGKRLDLARVNELRGELELPLFKLDENGNIVDDAGIPLDDDDWAQLGMMDDFDDKKDKFDLDTPWNAILGVLQQDPRLEEWLKTDEGGRKLASIEDWVSTVVLGGEYKLVDGQYVPDTDINAPWASPEQYAVWRDWPDAIFNPDGTVSNINYVGGEIKDPNDFARDKDLDEAWATYVGAGGTLGPQQWYYASQAGKWDKQNIEENNRAENIPDLNYKFESGSFDNPPDPEPDYGPDNTFYTAGKPVPVEYIKYLSQDDAVLELKNNYVNAGSTTPPPPELVTKAIPSIGLKGVNGLESFDGNPNGWDTTGNPGDWVNVDGNAIKLVNNFERRIGGGKGSYQHVVFEYNGEKYTYAGGEGIFYKYDEASEGRGDRISPDGVTAPWDLSGGEAE